MFIKAKRLNQNATPLFDAIIKRANSAITSFQTPGHNNGLGLARRALKHFGRNYFLSDVSVCSTVDSLDNPQSYILEAEKLLAAAYHVDQSYFLINGSTSGNQIMFLSTCHNGDKVIVPRNAHKSVIGSIILSQVQPIWIKPSQHSQLNIIYNVSWQQVRSALKQHPDAKAIFITSPTYNGIVTNLKKIADIVHRKNRTLLVDEAWGAHLPFHKKYPMSGVQVKSDLVVHSFHKMLPVPNQGSVLHVNGLRVDTNKIKKMISLIQTSSPSYPLLALMDLARNQLIQTGQETLEQLLNFTHKIKKDLRKIGLICLEEKDLDNGEYRIDPTKITIDIRPIGLSGFEVEQLLFKKYKIQIEAANIDHIIVVIKYGTTEDDVTAFIRALGDLVKNYHGQFHYPHRVDIIYSNDQIMEPAKAFFSENEWVSVEHSVDKICAEVIAPYPPGIPILVPGERVTKEILEYIVSLKKAQARIQSADPTLQSIRVVKI